LESNDDAKKSFAQNELRVPTRMAYFDPKQNRFSYNA